MRTKNPESPNAMQRTGSPSRPRLLVYLSFALMLAASLLPVVAAHRLAYPIDDAYITMNYARSIAAGRGIVFGDSEQPTYGSTTPLNMLLLAGLYTVLPGVDQAQIAVMLSTAAWIATGWLWYGQGGVFGLRRWERTWVALLVLAESALWIPFLGMEAWLFAFLLTLALVVYLRGRLFWAGTLTGLLFLTRGEGVLLLTVLAIHLTRRTDRAGLRLRRKPLLRSYLRLALGFGWVTLPWLILALATFGALLPGTLAAKSIQVQMGFTQPFIAYLGWLFVGEWRSLGFIGGAVGLSWWAVLAVLGAVYAGQQRRALLLLLVWLLLFVLGYFALNIPTYKWYALPVVYITTVFAGIAAAAAVDWGQRLVMTVRPRLSPLVGMLPAFLIVAVMGLTIVSGDFSGAMVVDERHDVYQALAGWLDAQTPVDSRIGYVEIGYLGWYSHRSIVDMLGLTNPEFVPFLRNRDFVGAFWLADVDYLICATQFAWACRDITPDADFQRQYEILAILPAAALNPRNDSGQTYTIYRKRP